MSKRVTAYVFFLGSLFDVGPFEVFRVPRRPNIAVRPPLLREIPPEHLVGVVENTDPSNLLAHLDLLLPFFSDRFYGLVYSIFGFPTHDYGLAAVFGLPEPDYRWGARWGWVPGRIASDSCAQLWQHCFY